MRHDMNSCTYIKEQIMFVQKSSFRYAELFHLYSNM